MTQKQRERNILDKAGLESQDTIFVVDWDGVCVEGVWPEWGDWLPGAVDGLKKLCRLGRVRIHSSRLNPYKFGHDGQKLRDPEEVRLDIATMRGMLNAADLWDVQIHTTHGKPTGHYYIDDRAVEFTGSWDEVLEKVAPSSTGAPSAATLPADADDTGGRTGHLAPVIDGQIRSFETGATRNLDTNKHDYEGFLSIRALRAFGRYMHAHRRQKDGSLRDSDNWQRGIPLEAYMKSMLRHVFDIWDLHRGGKPINPDTGEPVTMEEALMGAFFNVQGYTHEHLGAESKEAAA